MKFLSRSIWYQQKDLRLYGAKSPNFCVSFLLRLLCFLRCRSQNRENPYQNHQAKNEKVTKKVHLSSKDYASFSEISSIGQLLRQCPMWETGFNGHSETDD